MILIDLNIILDVVQNRQPYYPYSAKIIDVPSNMSASKRIAIAVAIS